MVFKKLGDNIIGAYIDPTLHNSNRATTVGKFMREQVDRVFGSGDHEYKIIEAGMKGERKAYRLEKIERR